MTITEIGIGLTIYLIIPLSGLFGFLLLRIRMKKENVQNRPDIELFIIFATYGGLILVVLTELFWSWSGMASLGTFYLLSGAPIVMGIIAYRHRHTKNTSKYHLCTYILGLSYCILSIIAYVIILVTFYFMGDKSPL